MSSFLFILISGYIPQLWGFLLESLGGGGGGVLGFGDAGFSGPDYCLSFLQGFGETPERLQYPFYN